MRFLLVMSTAQLAVLPGGNPRSCMPVAADQRNAWNGLLISGFSTQLTTSPLSLKARTPTSVYPFGGRMPVTEYLAPSAEEPPVVADSSPSTNPSENNARRKMLLTRRRHCERSVSG